MDIYNKAVNEVIQYAEKKIAELRSQKDATIRVKQATYKAEVTDTLIAEISKERQETLDKLKAQYDKDVARANQGFDTKKAELIEKGNEFVRADEEYKHAQGILALENLIKSAKGE